MTSDAAICHPFSAYPSSVSDAMRCGAAAAALAATIAAAQRMYMLYDSQLCTAAATAIVAFHTAATAFQAASQHPAG